MTCREKWLIEHPYKNFVILDVKCPSTYGYMEDPEEYRGPGEWECLMDCNDCWNREIPEEPKKKENNMNEPIEHTCAECAHQDVCKHMNEFMAAKQAIVDTNVVIGDKTHVKLLNIPCIKAVGLQCKFYRKDTKTR